MPLLTRTFVKTAMAYFMLALALGMALMLNVGKGLFPVYIHLFVFGWLTQLIFGVVHWMFPKYSTQLPRGREWLGWLTYGALNFGLLLRAIAEPIQSFHPGALPGVLLVASAVLQWLAGITFIANTWRRVKEK